MCVLGDYPEGGSGRDPDTDHDQIQEHDLDCIRDHDMLIAQ
jgi:hypothetical protein